MATDRVRVHYSEELASLEVEEVHPDLFEHPE